VYGQEKTILILFTNVCEVYILVFFFRFLLLLFSLVLFPPRRYTDDHEKKILTLQ